MVWFLGFRAAPAWAGIRLGAGVRAGKDRPAPRAATTKGLVAVSNVVDLLDQTFFAAERATGTFNVLQCVWVYNREVDINRLRQFHHHLQRGRLARRIQCSPLPFGRHRWVSSTGPTDLEIVAVPRPREEFDAWVNEQASAPLDAERGPEWRLAVHPFVGGGAGVSLVISHCLTDAVGLCEAVADAACGRDEQISWPAPGSRRRWEALREDGGQAARDIPGIARAVVDAARSARRHRGHPQPAAPPRIRTVAALSGADRTIMLPAATILVDAEEWDARAQSLGGTSNTLLAGLAVRLARRLGRVTADGSITVGMPVSERSAGDTRANAVTKVDITVDPASAATDLRQIRAATKEALIRRQQLPSEQSVLLPLVPLLPRWLVRRTVGVAAGNVSSNIGVVNPAACRPDGTDADHFAVTGSWGVSTSVMDRSGGYLGLLSGRTSAEIFVSVLAYQPGRSNSNDDLRQNLSSTLSEFSLIGTMGWGCPEPVGGPR